MSEIVVIEHLTLDGVMQAPGRADEDTRDGFPYGGWALVGNDAVMARVMGEGMSRGGSLLLGRRTYEDFYSFWPNQKDNPFTDVLNNMQKYVASTTLTEPLPWSNSTLLKGDVAQAVRKLKEQPDNDMAVFGSGELVRSLWRSGVPIDRYVLMIHPVVLGQGRRLFSDGSLIPFRLADSVTTTTGVVIATYEPVAICMA